MDNPVITSNSVLDVPPPIVGTVKYPEEYSSESLLKFGIGSSLKVKSFISVGSKNDSN